MRARLSLLAICLWALSGPAGAETCALSEAMTRLAAAQTQLIERARSGQVAANDPALSAMRAERAVLARINLRGAIAGTDLEERRRELHDFINGAVALEQVIGSRSALAVQDHLRRPATLGRVEAMTDLLAGFDCQTGRLGGGGIGDFSIPLMPSGQLGAVFALVSASVTAGVFWALSRLHAQHEALRRRYIVSVPGRISAASGSGPVRVNNLSRLGAQVSLGQSLDPEAGDAVILDMAGLSVPARVAWRKTGIAGLTFNRRVAPDAFADLTHSRAQQRPRTPPRQGDPLNS